MHRYRVFGVLLVVLVVGICLVLIYHRGPGWIPGYPGCVFRNVTGFLCPGCGMTRATHSTLHGQFTQAFRFNPLGVLLLPVVGIGIALETWNWMGGKPPTWRLQPGIVGAKVLIVVIFAYWILRNLPWWPFTLLAPP
ncbi:MAG: DUF2752 domain-containing protein [Luteolibacter sp.]